MAAFEQDRAGMTVASGGMMNLYRSLILLCLLCLQPVQALDPSYSRHTPEILPPRWSDAELAWLRQTPQLPGRPPAARLSPVQHVIIAQQRFEASAPIISISWPGPLQNPGAAHFPDKAHLLRPAPGEIHLASLGNLTLADTGQQRHPPECPLLPVPPRLLDPEKPIRDLLTPGQRVAAVQGRSTYRGSALLLPPHPGGLPSPPQGPSTPSSSAARTCSGMPTPCTTSTASASTTCASAARPRPSWRLRISASPCRPTPRAVEPGRQEPEGDRRGHPQCRLHPVERAHSRHERQGERSLMTPPSGPGSGARPHQGVADGQPLPLWRPDHDGQLTGMTVDMLARVGKRSGLRFEFVSADSERQLAKAMQSGAIDLIGAISRPVAEGYDGLRPSAPYAADDIYVILTRQEVSAIDTLQSLAGKTVGMTRHTLAGRQVAAVSPLWENAEEAMQAVEQGRLDAAIVPLALPATRWRTIRRPGCASPVPPTRSRSGWDLPACATRGC